MSDQIPPAPCIAEFLQVRDEEALQEQKAADLRHSDLLVAFLGGMGTMLVIVACVLH